MGGNLQTTNANKRQLITSVLNFGDSSNEHFSATFRQLSFVMSRINPVHLGVVTSKFNHRVSHLIMAQYDSTHYV